MKLEFFPCSGGMAEGFRRAGVVFDFAFDVDADACASYEANHGHRPIQMDVRDLLRMSEAGWRPATLGRFHTQRVDILNLIVADPPCTPWSRAGKRKGTDDARDMLLPTIELIRLLRPRAYLIGNVPGLDDAPNWPIVQRALRPLAEAGYCIADYAALDAANYGVPQHRVRPFWFGHLDGPCIRWPAPTHGDPSDPSVHSPLPGLALKPWVTCREALGHLPAEELGRPVKMRREHSRQNGKEHGSNLDAPARGVGTSTLSHGNTLKTNVKHPINTLDAPSYAVTTKGDGRDGQGACVLDLDDGSRPQRERRTPRTPQSARTQDLGEPARTVRGGRSWGAGQFQLEAPDVKPAKRGGSTQGEQWSRVHSPDATAPTVLTDSDRVTGNGVKLAWPWDRPATSIAADDRIPPPGHKPEDWGSMLSLPDAVVLSERAAAILQGFPEGWTFAGKTKTSRWSQIGQAMPPALAEAVARAVKRALGLTA